MFSVIARWRLFKKLGYKGWVFLIPFYSDFCLFEALYGNGWRILRPLWVVPLIVTVSSVLSTIIRNYSFIVIGFLIGIMYVVYFVISFVTALTHSFGKSGWWTLGTLLFFPVFLIVYGISDFLFMDNPYPDKSNYDAIDGFIDFFRSQNLLGKKDNTNDSNKRFCPNCGMPVSPDAQFCNECGTPIE